MNKILTYKVSVILIAMVIINFICDISLFYNFHGANIDFAIVKLKETPLYLIKFGSLIGVLALSILITPVYGWIKNKVLSFWIIVPYLFFIGGCILFHGLFYFLGNALHNNSEVQFIKLNSFIEILGPFVFLSGFILTIALTINRYKKRIFFPIWTLLLFPLFTMVFFGVILNKVIYLPKPIGGYYAVLSGTIPIFLLIISLRQISTIDK
jgi:hypothetical protein